MSFRISMRGDKELARLLSRAPEILRQASDNATEKIASRIVDNAKFNCPVKTGRLQKSIRYSKATGGFGGRSIGSWQIGAYTPYASFVEFGTRYMAGRYFVRNAFLMVQPDINRTLREQIRLYWRNAH